MEFQITESDKFSVFDRGKLKYFYYSKDISYSFEGNSTLKSAIDETFKYLKTINIVFKPFKLTINNKLNKDDQTKYGFGSSAALVTGTIKTILTFYNVSFTEELIFKIAVLTKLRAEKYSSGGDLASSLFKGLIYYRKYNLKWVLKNINDKNIYNLKWPHLKIVPIESDFNFFAVWTKEQYKTKPLSYVINKSEYKKAKKIVKYTLKSILNNDFDKLNTNLKNYQSWLETILRKDQLVTKNIKKAIEVTKNNDIVCKISGAGGGDSLICLMPKNFNYNKLAKQLDEAGLEFVNI